MPGNYKYYDTADIMILRLFFTFIELALRRQKYPLFHLINKFKTIITDAN